MQWYCRCWIIEEWHRALSGPGPYTMAHLPPATNYRVHAFVDLNGDGVWTDGEPTAAYPGNPFDLATNKTGVDLNLGGETPSPTLAISLNAGKIVITWDATATGFELQGSDVLPATAWTPVSGVQGNSISVDPVGTARLFRLKK